MITTKDVKKRKFSQKPLSPDVINLPDRPYFSEVISLKEPAAKKRILRKHKQTAETEEELPKSQNLVWKVGLHDISPLNDRLTLPPIFKKSKPWDARRTAGDFPIKTYEPKLQLAFDVPPRQMPRKVALKKLKETFEATNLEQLLARLGISSAQLRVSKIRKKIVDMSDLVNTEKGTLEKEFHAFLPLELFDDTEYDCRTPHEWIALGDEGGKNRGVPAAALLPKTVLNVQGEKENVYGWQDVAVLSYDDNSALYRVRKLTLPHQQPDKRVFYLPRIYVMFKAENPVTFAQRVAAAYRLRQAVESALRYHTYVDCMPTHGLMDYDEGMARRILLRAIGENSRFESLYPVVLDEINLEYKRTQNQMIFDSIVSRDPQLRLFIEIPAKEERKIPEYGYAHQGEIHFKDRTVKYAFESLLTKPEVLAIRMALQQEMAKLIDMDLFQLPLAKPYTLEAYEKLQTSSIASVSHYLRTAWIRNSVSAIRQRLENEGLGWFFLRESDWFMYRNSRLRKFNKLINFIMTDSLKTMMENSYRKLVKVVTEVCGPLPEVRDGGYEWTEPLDSELLKSDLQSPLWHVDLFITDEGGTLSVDPAAFIQVVDDHFLLGIEAGKDIKQIENLVMNKMFWGEILRIESVVMEQAHVQEWRRTLQESLRRVLKPIRAYSALFTPFTDMALLDVAKYMRNYAEKAPSVDTIKNDLFKNRDQKNDFENRVPASICIGPFFINVESVRKQLIFKCNAVYSAMVDFLAARLRETLSKTIDDFKELHTKLASKPGCIEDVSDKREWMKGVPDMVASLQDSLNETVGDYKTLEDLRYNLRDDDFNQYWLALHYPHMMLSMLRETYELVELDELRFRQLMVTDLEEMDEKIDLLKMNVASLLMFKDLSKASDYANDIRKIQKDLKHCEQLAILYNGRERLLNLPITKYTALAKVSKDFEPFRVLWLGVSEWFKWEESWMNDPLIQIDVDAMDKTVSDTYKNMVKSCKVFQDEPDILQIAEEVKNKITEFKKIASLMHALCHPGMQQRHWDELYEKTDKLVDDPSSMNIIKCLQLGLDEDIEVLAEISEFAKREYEIEANLNKIAEEWREQNFEITPYKNTNTSVVKVADEIIQLLDDHTVLAKTLSFSPFKKHFEERITELDEKFTICQRFLEELMAYQTAWIQLEPIFASEDIARQLPIESKRFTNIDRTWRRIMKSCNDNPKVFAFCSDQLLLKQLIQANKFLEQIQKGLMDYLETKRLAFPRFYFLSDDELLQILSQARDPLAVQPHLKKCFENVALIKFEEDFAISAMISGEGEVVPLKTRHYPEGNIEDWLVELEEEMRDTLRRIIQEAIPDFQERELAQWVLEWPGQVVIAVSQVFWTMMVEESIVENDIRNAYKLMLAKLDILRQLVQTPLKRVERQVLSALIVIEVHARDVVVKLSESQELKPTDFEWISQLRYYWVVDHLYLRAMNAQFKYGYEYLGNSGRLVITPLTDRCYLTLTGALHLKYGGAPAGPAGTGKTETTKDLAKAMAVQCVVFNCSDQLDYLAMGKFFKGLASSGAWACFDEFNRIDIEVLSVVAQQISTIQRAQLMKVSTFILEGVELPIKDSCAVFITMNPGYAGRTELPDNLKALFRPVAMMVPDYTLIAEISLFSFGFYGAKVIAKKITTTFKLSSEQLSSQDHYDFGMRAVKTVIAAAGNLKRDNPKMEEAQIALKAIRDVNVPKFLADDLKLFNGIVSDLFPGIKDVELDYSQLTNALVAACHSMTLQPVPGFLHKCIQLYETTIVRHGLMLVGPTGSGKTRCYQVLKEAITSLAGQLAPNGSMYEAVHAYVMNPKSITMGQLYGEFDIQTHEWTDGILPTLMRIGTEANNLEKRWYMFDGPVDAVWIENMNTVLDDNKKLCLSNGEIIKMTEPMTMMFEVADLAVASPATVSRCGMVFLEPVILGLDPFVACWMLELPDFARPYEHALLNLFNLYLKPAIAFIREEVREYVSSVDSNLTFSLLKMMDSFFQPIKESKMMKHDSFRQRIDASLKKIMAPWFIFCVIWSIGATCDGEGRAAFSVWLRATMAANKTNPQLPADGLVYDYCIDSRAHNRVLGGERDEGDEEERSRELAWLKWMFGRPPFEIPPGTPFQDILVPTVDTIRSAYIIGNLLECYKPVLCVGPTGTGKSRVIMEKLSKKMPAQFVSEFLVFSARTSAIQTQDLVDSKLDRKRRGVYGPPPGKFFVFFIDDLNMPALEEYGAQPPIELLRQYMDFKGWYDHKVIGEFHTLLDINFLTAMGPPGGGRNPITSRLTRHFNMISFTEMEDESKEHVFGTILNSWMELINYSASGEVASGLVQSSIQLYNAILVHLLPTPSRSHYTFNLRNLAQVFQGILMSDPASMFSAEDLYRLWYHENCRVYQDRLINDEDRSWFHEATVSQMQKTLGAAYSEVVPVEPLWYTDFMIPTAATRLYSEVTEREKIQGVIEGYLEEYNSMMAPMPLVIFEDAISSICKICRILRQPEGNALLLGMGGSGRQSLSKLSAFINDHQLFQIELNKNYGSHEWKEDLRQLVLEAGLKDSTHVFLFSDTQIRDESYLEDLNSLLNSGDVPNLLRMEEKEQVYRTMKQEVMESGLPITQVNMYSAFVKHVRSQLHVVLTMSPIGEVFRARLRQFPALVNCCTVNWFTAWPPAALEAVASTFIHDIDDLKSQEASVVEGIISMCGVMHQSVSEAAARYFQEQSRPLYITPSNYMVLIKNFKDLYSGKLAELNHNKNRTKGGLDKLLSTAEEVAILQEDLEKMKPLLMDAATEAEATMKKIQSDSVVAKETKKMVQEEEDLALEMARATQHIADDAQRDLDVALPALESALSSLKNLNKGDVTEVRAMQRPPEGVKMVIEAVSIMFSIKPKKIPGAKPGVKIDDYWDVGKVLLADPAKFISDILSYDKDNIKEDIIAKINPYVHNESFTPQAISKVSKACTSICEWVRAMHTYHYVAKTVAPKRAALEEAKAKMKLSEAILKEARAKLASVEAGIAELQADLNRVIERKKELEAKRKECEERLVRADRLIIGLADEKVRWAQSVADLDLYISQVVGDIVLASGCIAYLGPFSVEYRQRLQKMWLNSLLELQLPVTKNPNFVATLGDPALLQTWQICGLPSDAFSSENGIIAKYSLLYPLFIDPQGQANRWIKSMELHNELHVTKLVDKDFMRILEMCIRFGKPCLLENVQEDLDPSLEPVLLKQIVMQAGSLSLRLGDILVPFNKNFRLYITTKLANPHYTPDVSTRVNLINFILSASGLEDQLLGYAVSKERPDLQEAKTELIVNNAKMQKALHDIEDQILQGLTESTGSPVDDIDLINALEASKITSSDIKAKVTEAEETERGIDSIRIQYVPVAVRARILFFCMADLAKIDPMYQYSLEYFINIFLTSIEEAQPSEIMQKRLQYINESFTFNLYRNVCRSLFERHKLMFAFLLTTRILIDSSRIDLREWRFLLSGSLEIFQTSPNPAPRWLPERVWRDLQSLGTLPRMKEFPRSFSKQVLAFKKIFDSTAPHREPLPPDVASTVDSFQKLLILKCLRLDSLPESFQDYVAQNLGQRFIEPQSSDLSHIFKESSCTVPLIFILSQGTDPARELNRFAEEMKFQKKLTSVSLGQGQGPRAEAIFHAAIEQGTWAFFQNCHLAPSWMPKLERLIEQVDPNKTHRDFRLWLTSMPSPAFPVSILQRGSKMTVEPPRGIKANLLKIYSNFSDDYFSTCPNKPKEFKGLLFSLCLFHSAIMERRKFGPLGFNIAYEFMDGDLQICINQLRMFLSEYYVIPYKVLSFTAGEINYGGRVTDDWDRRCIMSILDDFYRPEVLRDNFRYTETYRQMPPDTLHIGYIEYLQDLPLNDPPELFGLHENANITYAQNESYKILNSLTLLQPKTATSAEQSREEVISHTAQTILAQIPAPFDMKLISQRYPLLYEQSMNTVLSQEAVRFNKLLDAITKTLKDLLKALKGIVVMSQALENMATSLFLNAVPKLWAAKAYPSLKPLASWVADLMDRLDYVSRWVERGIPPAFWISGFYFPQAFLTGSLQNYARKHQVSIDKISFGFKILTESPTAITKGPTEGCYIYGLFLEGARWDGTQNTLVESVPKELYTEMAMIHMIPQVDIPPPTKNIYVSPVYKTLARAGTLSTTGHSTNYVLSIFVPSNMPQKHWIKRGVAMFCALNH